MAARTASIAGLIIATVGLGHQEARADAVQNGSFNVGLQGWSCHTRGAGGYPNDVRLASIDPRPVWNDAKFRYDAPDNSSFVVASRAHETAPGTYELRALVRTETEIAIELIDSGRARENVIATIDVVPGDDWQQVRTEVAVEAEQVAIAVRGQGPGVVELDDIELNGESDTAWAADLGLAASSRDGVFMLGFGGSGDEGVALNHPAGVAVDSEGDVYVTDWGNKLVRIYDSSGEVLTALTGDAQELSKWSKAVIEANPDGMKAYRRVKDLSPPRQVRAPGGDSGGQTGPHHHHGQHTRKAPGLRQREEFP